MSTDWPAETLMTVTFDEPESFDRLAEYVASESGK